MEVSCLEVVLYAENSAERIPYHKLSAPTKVLRESVLRHQLCLFDLDPNIHFSRAVGLEEDSNIRITQ